MAFIWVAAEGVITADTPKQFEAFLQSYDAKIVRTIEFHSPGGNLAAALQLGRMIRKAGYRTSIGRSISLKGIMSIHHYKDAHCLSACAYAFLGGAVRHYDSAKRYGLHRFGLPDRPVEGDVAQVVTSELAAYVEEMGVDQRILRLASSTDSRTEMRYVPISVAKSLRIIFDPDQPTDFAIEEYRGRASARIRFFFRECYYDAMLYCA